MHIIKNNIQCMDEIDKFFADKELSEKQLKFFVDFILSEVSYDGNDMIIN